MDSNTATVAPSGVQAFLTKLAVFIQQNKFALIILCALGLGVCLFMMTRGTKEEIKKKSAFVVYRKRFQMYLKKMYVWVMHVAERIPVLGSLIGNVCYGYKCQEALTEDDAVLRTGKVLWWMLVSFIAAFVFGMAWFKDITLSLITAFILAHVVMTSLKSNSRKYLIGLNDAVEDFLLAYHKSSGNIDEAFYAVIRSRNQVSRHFEIMHEYIKRAYVSDNPELIQSEYNAIAPSRFLRSLFAVIYMTYKYGDQKDDGKSALNVNIMEIQEQIGDALYQQNKLLDDTMGERWFIILPLYAIPLLGDYMLEFFAFEGFEYIESFLTSSTGYMVSVLCAIITLICYLLYAQMVDRGILEAKSRNSWEKEALRNAHIRKWLLKAMPMNSPKRKKLQATINRAGSTDTVNALQIRRMFLALTMVIVGTLSVGLNVVTNRAAINNDIYTGMAKDNYTQLLMTQDDMYTYIDEMLDADKQIIKYLDSTGTYWTLSEDDQKQEIRSYMTSSGLVDNYRGYESYGVDRIFSKMQHLEKVGGLNNLIFVILLTLFGYFMPLALVYLRAFMNKDMILLDEVTDLQKTTIMLMNYSSTTPDSLLTWYASSSIMLAPQLKECSVTHDFDELINSIAYKPFTQLATSLQMAFDGLPLKEAFSGVEQRLLTQRKEQARIMDNMLKFRTSTVEMFTSISMGAIIGLYMFMPLLISMIQMFRSIDVF